MGDYGQMDVCPLLFLLKYVTRPHQDYLVDLFKEWIDSMNVNSFNVIVPVDGDCSNAIIASMMVFQRLFVTVIVRLVLMLSKCCVRLACG